METLTKIFPRKGGSLLRCFKILTKQDQIKLVYVICLQFLFAILDFIGIACIGILGALSISGIQSQNIDEGKVNTILSTFISFVASLRIEFFVSVLSIFGMLSSYLFSNPAI